MPQSYINDVGETVEAYSAEEVAAINAEKAAAEAAAAEAKEHLAKKTDEFVRAKQGLTGEIKKLADMSEEEKAKMSASEQELRGRLEQQEEVTKRERDAAKEAMFIAVAGSNADLLAKLKEKYALVTLPEGTTEEIRTRINSVAPWAFSELGIVERRPVPIEAAILGGGEAPRSREDGETRFADTEKGKAATEHFFGNVLPKDNK